MDRCDRLEGGYALGANRLSQSELLKGSRTEEEEIPGDGTEKPAVCIATCDHLHSFRKREGGMRDSSAPVSATSCMIDEESLEFADPFRHQHLSEIFPEEKQGSPLADQAVGRRDRKA